MENQIKKQKQSMYKNKTYEKGIRSHFFEKNGKVFQSFVAFSEYLNFRNIVTYFLRWSIGNLMSFCIRTLIISPGVPTSPPQAPAPAAIATLWKNDIGSPFGLTYFFAV